MKAEPYFGSTLSIKYGTTFELTTVILKKYALFRSFS